jgi:hypothetical protein
MPRELAGQRVADHGESWHDTQHIRNRKTGMHEH